MCKHDWGLYIERRQGVVVGWGMGGSGSGSGKQAEMCVRGGREEIKDGGGKGGRGEDGEGYTVARCGPSNLVIGSAPGAKRKGDGTKVPGRVDGQAMHLRLEVGAACTAARCDAGSIGRCGGRRWAGEAMFGQARNWCG